MRGAFSPRETVARIASRFPPPFLAGRGNPSPHPSLARRGAPREHDGRPWPWAARSDILTLSALSSADPDRLLVRELDEPVRAQFTAETAVLRPTEGDAGI